MTVANSKDFKSVDLFYYSKKILTAHENTTFFIDHVQYTRRTE
jgi:hypothetical protein